MRNGTGLKSAALLFVYCPGHKPAKADIKAPPPVDAFPTIAYLEPTESVAQAPRFPRHLIDKWRHLLDLSAWKTQL